MLQNCVAISKFCLTYCNVILNKGVKYCVFNNALNTFYLWLYVDRRMVRENLLLLFDPGVDYLNLSLFTCHRMTESITLQFAVRFLTC